MLDCEIVTTKSGAWAVHDRVTGETMHPVIGPLAEARQVYVEPSRLRARLCEAEGPGALVLFDAGLGAGSNALAAWCVAEEARSARRRLSIISVDHSLAAFELAQRPEYAAAFGFEAGAASAARGLLTRHHHETERSDWRLLLGDLREKMEELPTASVDVVYWDPFSALSCPELWSVQVFRDLRRVCRRGATLHTFCTSTPARSALLLAGFFVGDGPTTGNGRATTLAAVDREDVRAPLEARFLSRLSRSSAPFPADAAPDALELLLALPQFALRD